MKKIFLPLLFLLSNISFGITQEKFRADFNYVCFYEPDTKTWSEWEHAEHTLVFNINSNQDIIHFTAKGETITYRNIGNKDDGYTNGNHYQILDAIDDEGNYIRIQLFDDPAIGMKLILGNNMIQFSKG